MAVENDLNNSQVVTDSGVVEAATTEEAGVSQEVAADVSVTPDAGVQQEASQVTTDDKTALADGTDPSKPVPYDRFKQVNDEKNSATARVTELEQHVQNLRLTQANPPQQTEQPQQQSLTAQVMKDKGIDPEEILTGAQQAEITDEVVRRVSVANQAQFQTQSFISSKPDFAKVVGAEDAATGQFKFAPPLQRVIDSNPGIATALRNAGSGANMLAYELGSKDPTYMAELVEAAKLPAQKNSEAAQQVIDAANKQVSISAVAGVGNLDKGAAILAMNDEEFEQHKQQVMAQRT